MGVMGKPQRLFGGHRLFDVVYLFLKQHDNLRCPLVSGLLEYIEGWYIFIGNISGFYSGMLVDYQDYLDEINALNDYIRLAIAIVLIALALFVAKYALIRPWWRFVTSTEADWDDYLFSQRSMLFSAPRSSVFQSSI